MNCPAAAEQSEVMFEKRNGDEGEGKLRRGEVGLWKVLPLIPSPRRKMVGLDPSWIAPNRVIDELLFGGSVCRKKSRRIPGDRGIDCAVAILALVSRLPFPSLPFLPGVD